MIKAKQVFWLALFVVVFIASLIAILVLCEAVATMLGTFSLVITLSALLGFILYTLLTEVFGWILRKLFANGEYQEAGGRMNHEQLSELLSNMNSLQAGSFEARQALIRESFTARYRPSDFRAKSYRSDNRNATANNPIIEVEVTDEGKPSDTTTVKESDVWDFWAGA